MKHRFIVGCSAIATVLFAGPAGHAYEVETHAHITASAMQRSDMFLSNAPSVEFFSQLGLEFVLTPSGTFSPDSFGQAYFDVSGSRIITRIVHDYDADHMPLERVEQLSLPAWLMRGAIREDDLGPGIGDDPKDDPHGNIYRVLNHFWDPVFDRPLTVINDRGQKAPDWGLGVYDAFSDPTVVNATRRNHFTIADAREAMYRALTGETSDGLDAGFNNTPATRAVRRTYWATTFHALGSFLHLNQDMAQPQHTRNDAHAGLPGTGHKSIYEAYVECRATQEASRVVTNAGGTARTCRPLQYEGYPVPAFNRYSLFFSSREGLEGTGLADYSNRGFFSAGKNLHDLDNDYPAPVRDASAYATTPVALVDIDADYMQFSASLSVLKGSVRDTFTNQVAVDVPLTTAGLWRRPLGELASEQNIAVAGYTLTRQNYDAMADLLVPRAVAYSAGLINYFFRGRLTLALPPEGVFSAADASSSQSFTTLAVAVRNTSTSGEQMSLGSMTAVVRFHRNTCYSPELSGEYALPGNSACRAEEEEIALSEPQFLSLPHGSERVIAFDFSDDPIPHAATDIRLQVVYRGELGHERNAVAVGSVDLSEPTYFDIVNMTDYFLYEGTFYPVPVPFDASTVPSQVDPVLFRYVDDNSNGRYDAGTDLNLSRRELSYRLDVAGRPLAEVTLPPSSFARVVMLGGADTPLQIVLSKLSYGYEVPLQLQPLISQADSGRLPPAPFVTRHRYHYASSPDHGFYPGIVEVPEDLAPLAIPQPRPVTLRFPAL